MADGDGENKMRARTKTAFALLFFAVIPCSFASDLQPISSEYGICLKGVRELDIRINSPVDVEFASLVYKSQVIGHFEITILGPEYPLARYALKRWRDGGVVLVDGKDGYVGVKRNYSGGNAYPSVYIYLSLGRSAPNFLSKATLMKALSPCDLKAHPDFSSPPELDSVITDEA
ncbi:hypothetical protein HFP05_02940 [Rhodanobacter denitrificans]|nr:hypothetical protein [Rhodanobacter denitrificans]